MHEQTVIQQAAQLEGTLAELARSNRELEQFAYVVSHDLNEPLRMITGYLQLLNDRHRDCLPPDGQEFLDYAIEGGTRMKDLLADLLTYSRVGRHREVEAVDCQEAFEAVKQHFALRLEENGGTLEASGLPTVGGSRTLILQLFQNLIANALRFHGREPPVVRLEAERQEGEWLFRCRDNGIGIAPKDQERIFAVFQRLHSRKKYPGTGVGLAICRRIVEQWGGKIWVESSPGQGAVFCFTLPAKET